LKSTLTALNQHTLSDSSPEYNKSSSDNMPEVSIVVPLLNEEESLRELTQQIRAALEPRFTYEVIFVDDGSTDKSWKVISELAETDTRIFGIRFRRNYGKSTALQKGFERARGQYIATMDADLQDDPREVPLMIDQLNDESLDLVSGWKKVRHDPISKTIPSRFFNKVTSIISGIDIHDFNCGLKVYRREVIDSLTIYGEMHRYIPVLAKWEGFSRVGEKVVQHHARKYGKTKFGLSRFLNGFLDLITLLFIHVYFQRPMHFFGSVGVGFLAAGTAITGYLVVMRIFFEQYLSNRPLLLFGILLLVLGLQFFSVGFLGEMMNKARAKERNVNIRESI
jgi:glycosyltransferase involved in cell wall biosynthesis